MSPKMACSLGLREIRYVPAHRKTAVSRYVIAAELGVGRYGSARRLASRCEADAKAQYEMTKRL